MDSKRCESLVTQFATPAWPCQTPASGESGGLYHSTSGSSERYMASAPSRLYAA